MSVSQTKVKVSTDGGATWKDYVEQSSTTVTPPPPSPTPTPTPVPPPPPPASTIVPTDQKDANGVLYVQPLQADGYRLNYKNETTSFTKNFRSDGSMRCDFKGTVRNSVYVAGYFKVTGSDSGEEVSAKMNGGPHNDDNPEYADTMDLGIISFDGTKSRLRWEKTHPDYSSGIAPTFKELPVGDVRNKWIGYCGLKVNLDTDKDGKEDKVAIVGMVDVGGLDASGKPANQWKVTYKRIFAPSEIALKSHFTPYVAAIGKPELANNTIRIDQQSQSAWTGSNPPYRYVKCCELTATKV